MGVSQRREKTVAQLHAKAYEFKRKEGLDFLGRLREEELELQRLTEQAAALKEDELVGALVTFPVADGRAIYLVKSEAPLKLQHIPFFDGYQIDSATIRGLRLEDIRKRVGWERGMRSMFAGRSTATS